MYTYMHTHVHRSAAATVLSSAYRRKLSRHALHILQQELTTDALTKATRGFWSRASIEPMRMCVRCTCAPCTCMLTTYASACSSMRGRDRFKTAAREEHQLVNLLAPPESDEALTPPQMVQICNRRGARHTRTQSPPPPLLRL